MQSQFYTTSMYTDEQVKFIPSGPSDCKFVDMNCYLYVYIIMNYLLSVITTHLIYSSLYKQ